MCLEPQSLCIHFDGLEIYRHLSIPVVAAFYKILSSAIENDWSYLIMMHIYDIAAVIINPLLGTST